MKVNLLYFLAKWSYRLLRLYMIELINIRNRPKQDECYTDMYELVRDILDELFDYKIVAQTG